MDSNKKLILIGVVALVIGLALGYFFWQKTKAKPEEQALEEAGEAAEKITESATKGALPSITTNPLESKPDINPADKANPFKNIKINPFE
jgi:type II secretory pathway pseudopilin PulG